MDAQKHMRDLAAYGADTVGAMERFLDDTALYESCLWMFIEDDNFEKLGDALAQKAYKNAFEAAHSLKGVASNLGVLPMLRAVEAIVEPLRGGAPTGDCAALYAEVLLQRERLKALLSA